MEAVDRAHRQVPSAVSTHTCGPVLAITTSASLLAASPSALQVPLLFRKQTPVVTESRRLGCSQIPDRTGGDSRPDVRINMQEKTRLTSTLLVTVACEVSPNKTGLRSLTYLWNCVLGTVPGDGAAE